jgi:hypothetical protein
VVTRTALRAETYCISQQNRFCVYGLVTPFLCYVGYLIKFQIIRATIPGSRFCIWQQSSPFRIPDLAVFAQSRSDRNPRE